MRWIYAWGMFLNLDKVKAESSLRLYLIANSSNHIMYSDVKLDPCVITLYWSR